MRRNPQEAVIDLATRGRKRGICLIAACLRISAFNKNAAAQLLNKAIGRTGLDIDQKRAGQELGFTERNKIQSLRDLEPGEFYVFGPALSKHIEKVKIGNVLTTHPTAGMAPAPVPLPTEKVKKVLVKLTDLPKEAEKEAKTKEELLAKIRNLNHELREQKRPGMSPEQIRRIQAASHAQGFKEASVRSFDNIRKLRSALTIATNRLSKITELVGGKIEIPTIEATSDPPKLFGQIPIIADPTVPRSTAILRSATQQVKIVNVGDVRFGVCERKILKFLSMQSDRSFSKQQIAAITQYSVTSGAYGASLSLLKKQNLILQRGDSISINQDEISRAQEIAQDIDLGSPIDWLAQLPAQDRKIYQTLYNNPSETFSREQLAEVNGYSVNSGSFGASISHLLTLGLAQKDQGGIRFNEKLAEWT